MPLALDDTMFDNDLDAWLRFQDVLLAAVEGHRDAPMPYAMSATILAIMTACGAPAIGGYLAGVAISMKKK